MCTLATDQATSDLHMILRIVITVIALLLIFVHRQYPSVAIKDQSEIGLIVLAVLPWLASVFKSVDIPGVGKFELQDLKRQVAETKTSIESVRQTSYVVLYRAWKIERTLPCRYLRGRRHRNIRLHNNRQSSS